MSFFDDVINTTKNAAQTAGKKTDEAVRFTKLKIKESQTSSDIKAHFEKLGQMAYEMKKAENPDAALFDAEIEEIDKLYEKLSQRAEQFKDDAIRGIGEEKLEVFKEVLNQMLANTEEG